MMLYYTIILICVVLVFLLYKNKEGVEAPALKVYLTKKSNESDKYKSFVGSFSNYCSYFDSGNGIHNALNQLSENSNFTDKINNCNSNNPTELNTCYASALLDNSVRWSITENNVPNCLVAYNNNMPIPELKNASLIVPGTNEGNGWKRVNFEATKACTPYNSLTEIDTALEQVKTTLMKNIGNCTNSILK